MSNKTLHFITGLPRSGSSVISSLLNQNPDIAGDTNSTVCDLLDVMNNSWPALGDNDPGAYRDIKIQTLRSAILGYYQHRPQTVIFDRHLGWTRSITLLEQILQRPVKVLVCVRNPAEILSSYERSRLSDPLQTDAVEISTGKKSNLLSRTFFISGPDGLMGATHRDIQDSVIMGYLDRMLFVDYGMFCSNPRSQTKRIYDFFDLPYFEHDFKNIMPGNPGVRSRLEKVTVNPVQYLGLDLFDQYNSQIFWNAWI
jgi:sulfotransferase